MLLFGTRLTSRTETDLIQPPLLGCLFSRTHARTSFFPLKICQKMLTAAIGVCLRPAMQAVMGNMKEEIEKALLPIIHYGVDLWTCTTSGRKFIDVHAFHVDSNFTLHHALLAVSHETVE